MNTQGTFHPTINDRALLANEAINRNLEEIQRLDLIERIQAHQGGYEIRDEELPSEDTEKLCSEIMVIIENYLLEDEDELELLELIDLEDSDPIKQEPA